MLQSKNGDCRSCRWRQWRSRKNSIRRCHQVAILQQIIGPASYIMDLIVLIVSHETLNSCSGKTHECTSKALIPAWPQNPSSILHKPPEYNISFIYFYEQLIFYNYVNVVSFYIFKGYISLSLSLFLSLSLTHTHTRARAHSICVHSCSFNNLTPKAWSCKWSVLLTFIKHRISLN